MGDRTPQEEMKVWKARVAELLEKEARCPGCIKLKLIEPTLDGTVCPDHRRIRMNMVFPPKRLGMYQ